MMIQRFFNYLRMADCYGPLMLSSRWSSTVIPMLDTVFAYLKKKLSAVQWWFYEHTEMKMKGLTKIVCLHRFVCWNFIDPLQAI